MECGLTRGSLPQEEVQQLEAELARAKREAADLRRTLRSSAGTRGAVPDFIIIGAQRCGTTYLYDLLRRHPYFKPAERKELHFFDRDANYAKGLSWYMSQFPQPDIRNGQKEITGEATPYYLCHGLAPQRAARMVPGAKLVVMLRNPIDRAYSGHMHHSRRGEESLSFDDAIAAERQGEPNPLDTGQAVADDARGRRVRRHHFHLARGIYVHQLREWQKYFSSDQILVIRSEDFFANPGVVARDVQRFVGLPDHDLDTASVRNRNLGTYKEAMAPATRKRLEAYFAPYNKELFHHLGRDLCW
ncbi:sulfotransferase domain-containing protein [Actinopolymorpha sp. B9G3]|uniref:sulfotransferase domain-containing protein n=1 Tax=Actinopolymorpha sp. B9G3 TaxID=3158970 RepID=UPI0032D9796B